MDYKVIFLPTAENDFTKFDKSIQNQILKKLKKLQKNPFCGELLSGNLKNLYKLYVSKKKIRIVYRIEADVLIVEVISIGKRDKKAVYKVTEKRIGKNNP